jgi:long-chain acyl-CoA synthetase
MFTQCLLDAAGRHPHRLAVRDPFRELTNAQLCRFARVIRRVVLKETSCARVGMMLPGSAGGLGTLLGIHWAGRTVVPLNLLLPPPELATVVADAQIDLILATRHLQSQLAGLKTRVLYLEQLPLRRAYLLEKFRRTPDPHPVSADDLAAIVYTSGSTGEPRGVCLSYGNLLSNCRAAIEHFRLDTSHHLLGVLPPFHVFGLTTMTLLPIVLGVPVTYVPRFSPHAVHEIIRAGQPSLIMAVPSMYAAIARLKSIQPADFASIQIAVSGGEPLPLSLYKEVLNRTGMNLLEGYGMTETSPVISANQPWAQRLGTVGRCAPGVQVQVRDQTGAVLPTGQTGELCVRGPGVMKGYFNRPRETAAAIDADGWLRTGDIVHLDEDGFITITGRAKEMMIVAGENVYPREVEAVLEQHPAVREAAVIGKPDTHRGEVVVAFIIPRENTTVTAQDLRTFCHDHLASHKIPREIHVVEELPRGPTGKILKRQLKTRIQS